ncbi:MAG: Arm DNA-binding domain-containing protein [Dissulfuribacterales bacterium]
MKIKLTSGQKGTVNKLPFPESGQALYWDNQLTGFGLRVTPKTKTYFVQARTSTGKSRRVSLGRHPTMTADKARKKALDTLSDFNAGLDPVVEKEKEKVVGVTLRDVVDNYLADRDLKKASIESIKYHLEKTFDDWADKPAVLITRDMVRKRFDEKTEESGPAQANLKETFLERNNGT